MNKTVTHFFLPHLLLSRKITRLGRNKICSKTPCWKLIRAIPFRHSWWLLKSFWGSFSRFQYYESTRTCIFYAILFLLRAMIGSEFECYRLRRHSVWSRWKNPKEPYWLKNTPNISFAGLLWKRKVLSSL